MSLYDEWLDRISGPRRRILKRLQIIDPVRPERKFNDLMVVLECGHMVPAHRGGRPNHQFQRCAFCLWESKPKGERQEVSGGK